MKKIFSVFAVAAMLSMAFACKEKEEPTPGPNPGPDPDPTPTEQTISEVTGILEATPLKTAWAEGDAILVYGVYADGDVEAKYVIASGAGTKSATFKAQGDGLKSGATAYYASYPYSSIDFAQHNTFSYTIDAELTADAPLFATSGDGEGFAFKSPLAGLEIKLSGKGNAAKLYIEDKNANTILNGNATYNAKTGKFSLKNGSASKNTLAKSFGTVALSDEPASFFMEIPEGALATGASLTVYNPANGMIGTAEIPAQTVKAGELTTVTVSLEATSSVADLSASESANCYVITEPGEYKFKTVKGNSPENVGSSATAEILWETYGTLDEVTPNSVIASVSYANDYVTFKTPETLTRGNALIAVKDAAGTILWSWHIWVVADMTLGTTDLGFGDGSQLMTYNLGALGEPGTPESFGLLYQWGRKDPFIGGASLGHSDTAAISGVEMTTTAEQAKVSEEFATQNPTTFVLVTGSDGMKDWLDPSDGTRWATTKGMHDPCPAGWRVPAEEDAPNFFTGELVGTASYGEEDSDYTFTVNGYKIPLGGSRGYTDGSYSKSDCKYFTCSGADGEYGDALRINGGGNPAWGVRRKAEGCSVRCVVDVPAAE